VIAAPTNFEEALEVIQVLLAKVADLEKRLAAAEARAEAAEARIAELEEENAQLRERLARYEGKKTPPRDPSTPSGAVPPYEKPGSGNTKQGKKGKKKRKKPGRKKGHEGARRATPDHVDHYEHHSLDCCPDCGCADLKNRSTRTRYSEDIPPVTPIVTEHTIEGGYCPNCDKWVEGKVGDVMPRCTLGNRMLLITAWLHFALGVAVHKVVTWLGSMCQMTVSAGGLTRAWARVAIHLRPLHEQIWNDILSARILHVDETSWRVAGDTFWLWCFATKNTVLYVIDPTRGSKVVEEILGDIFGGILVTDFYAAYNQICAWAKQKCIVHLLRELKKVSISNTSPQWVDFSKKLKRLLQDALRLGRDRDKYDDETFERRWKRMYDRLFDLYDTQYDDPDAQRLANRIEKYRFELFTFLEFDDVDADNNHGEREIRPAVQMRKAYGGNRSERGAEIQAILMTIFRTLQKRGIEPIAFLMRCLKNKFEHGQIPSLNSLDDTYDQVA
jgi:transposase